jgi:hypothetical protein
MCWKLGAGLAGAKPEFYASLPDAAGEREIHALAFASVATKPVGSG